MVISYEKIGNIRRLIRAHRIKTSHNMKPHNYSCAMAINPNMLGQFRTHCNYYIQNVGSIIRKNKLQVSILKTKTNQKNKENFQTNAKF